MNLKDTIAAVSALSSDDQLNLAASILRDHAVAHKIWLDADIWEMYNEIVEDAATDAEFQNVLGQIGSIRELENCTEFEWDAIRDEVRDALNSLGGNY